MTEVIGNPANKVTLSNKLTFEQVAEQLRTASMTSLSYGNGAAIELNPELDYSFLMLGLTRLLTSQEFGVVYMSIMAAIAQAESQGLIPPGLIKQVATTFDVPKVEGLDEMLDGLIPEGEELHLALRGTLGLEITKSPIPEVVVEETE